MDRFFVSKEWDAILYNSRVSKQSLLEGLYAVKMGPSRFQGSGY